MAKRIRMDRAKVRSAILTLRLTNMEMLRFKVAALSLGKRRARLVRERVADLIDGTMPQSTPVVGNEAVPANTVIDQPVIEANK